MQINIGMSATQRKGSAQVLNQLLCDEFVLYVKTINYHWNVKSKHFRDMHKFFLDQYEALLQISDDVAERIRSLDEPALGTLADFLKYSKLKEKNSAKMSDQQMVADLLESHETIIRYIREHIDVVTNKYNDLGTNNFLLNLLEKQEKMAWMLRSCLVK